MTHTCALCSKEYPDTHEWINVGNISVVMTGNGKRRVVTCEGQMWFCSVPCLNTFIYSMGDNDEV